MILYKYTKFQHFLSIVERGTLAFPLVSQLNDPCESSIESALSHLRTLERLPPLAHKPVVEYRVGQFKDVGINPLYDESLPKIEENRRRAGQNEGLKRLERVLEHFRDKVGVLSLTADPANAVMWAHYADQSRGVCVGIEFDRPGFESYRPSEPFYEEFATVFRMGQVAYRKIRPGLQTDVDTATYIHDAFFTKFEDWAYEREWRLLRPHRDCLNVPGVPVALYQIPAGCIAHVVMGLDMSEDNARKVLEVSHKMTFDVSKIESPAAEYSLKLTKLRKDGWSLSGKTPNFRLL